jgi:GAF domain-containing protein
VSMTGDDSDSAAGPHPVELAGPRPVELAGPRPVELAGPHPVELAGPHPVELAGLLHELTALLIDAVDLQEALERLAGLTARSLPGTLRCSVTLIGDGTPMTLAASGPAGRELDEVQYAIGQGPGLDATRTRTVVTCQDLSVDERWPALSACATGLGVHAVAAVPLDVQRHFVGALNLFVPRPGGIDAHLLITAMAVAGQSELLLAEVLRRTAQASVTADLVASLKVGATVDQAIGVIVAQRGCGVQEAYAILLETAERLDLRPNVVAERLLATASRRAGTGAANSAGNVAPKALHGPATGMDGQSS